jgi:hypothetical protein
MPLSRNWGIKGKKGGRASCAFIKIIYKKEGTAGWTARVVLGPSHRWIGKVRDRILRGGPLKRWKKNGRNFWVKKEMATSKVVVFALLFGLSRLAGWLAITRLADWLNGRLGKLDRQPNQQSAAGRAGGHTFGRWSFVGIERGDLGGGFREGFEFGREFSRKIDEGIFEGKKGH